MSGTSNDLSSGVPVVDRPADFDAFWSDTLAEARGHGLRRHVEEDTLRSDEQVRMFQVNYTSLERVQIFGWLAMPRAPGPHPAVVMLPGYSMRPNVGVRNMAYEGLATFWVSVRGHDFDSAIL